MSRESGNEVIDGRLWNGFDYEHQAWVTDGRYVSCGHPESMDCQCFGKAHEGEVTKRGAEMYA